MLKDSSKSILGTGLLNKNFKLKNHRKIPKLLVKIIIKAKTYTCSDFQDFPFTHSLTETHLILKIEFWIFLSTILIFYKLTSRHREFLEKSNTYKFIEEG